MALEHLTEEQFLDLFEQHDGNTCRVAKKTGVNRKTLDNDIRRRDLRGPIAQIRATAKRATADLRVGQARDDNPLVERVRDLLKRKRGYQVDTLADGLDVSPRRVREAVDQLRQDGFRIPEEQDGRVELHKIPPSRTDEVHQLPLELLDGDWVRLGVVSDTHLCSKECALDELHLAYDYFEQEEISTVLHAGDLVAGVGVFRNQHNEITHHTFEDQRDYAIERYPRREGVTTKIIGGNHDLEGDFGRVGADPVKGVANKRDDFDYLGAFEAFLEVGNGAIVHLLHGSGGMSYSFSYKAQKLVEGYPGGRKPAALIPGHWHVQGNFSPRGVFVTFPACFEWRTPFLARKGLAPTVGFHVLELQLGADGSIVEHVPRFKPFWEGRAITTPAT